MSSTTGSYAPSAEVAAPATANLIVAAVILGLFVVSSIVSAERKDITRGFDEVAHVSYVAHIQQTGNLWPALPAMRMLDPRDFHFTGEANYLSHPPIYYALLAVLGPPLVGHPQAVIVDRFIDIGLVAIALAAWLGLGLAARFSRHEFCAYATPVACVPVLVPLAGAVNNDDLGLLGGALATLAVWHLVATDGRAWLALALVGVVAAGWSKLTGLVLAGGMVGAVVAYLLWRRRLSWTWTIAVAFAFALAAVPYLIYILQYGGPVPNTPGFLAFVHDEVRDFGWGALPRRSLPGYLAFFAGDFIANWMPTLAARNPFQYAMLAIPVAALAGAGAGLVLSLQRLRRRQETTIDVVVISGALALAANLVLHVGYGYHFYAATGWLAGAYPRYYLPLAAIIPLACLSLLTAIKSPRGRSALLGFLIAGPLVFSIFGAPLG